MQCVYKSDFPGLQNFWMYLYRRFFSQLNNDSLAMAYRLETNVLRYVPSIHHLSGHVYQYYTTVCVCYTIVCVNLLQAVPGASQ